MKSKVGWVITVLPSLLLLYSGFGKVTEAAEVLQAMPSLGIDASMAKGLGYVEILITILYLIPRTSFIGAILITGWMGGAIITHLRFGQPFFIQIIIPILVWIGFGLRYYSEILPLLGLRRPR